MLQSISSEQRHCVALWYVLQHAISAYDKVKNHFPSLEVALQPSSYNAWQQLKLHKSHLERFQHFHTAEGQKAFEACLQSLTTLCDFILTEDDADYPQQLIPYTDKPPILFGQGNITALNAPQIAIVGSRKPSPHGEQVAYDFAYYLADQGFYINSGLAQGIDKAAHIASIKCKRAIAVIGTGLDQTYPTAHHNLRQEILQNEGCIITEFLPGTPPLQHHFPRRNRIVSGLSLGVIVAEAALKSGSLITAKLAAEQGKTVFAIPGHIYSEHHQGCHQLIREGAILIDHPEQVIEDLALATTWQQQTHQNSQLEKPLVIPEHLNELYQQLDWIGLSIDHLAEKTELNISELSVQLMELELLGLIKQQAGLYLRCRSE